MRMPRVALIVSHPIQHFCPQYASLAKSSEYQFKVFFASTLGSVPYRDTNFNREVQWNNLKLDQFDHEFLNNKPIPISRKLDVPHISTTLDSYDPDVVITHGYCQRFQNRVAKWSKTRHRLLYYIADSETHRQENVIKRSIKSLFLRRYFRSIDRFLTVGNANEFYYHRLGVPTERMTRMQFSIDVEQFESAIQERETLRKEIRDSLKVDRDCIVVSTVGKLVVWKRQQDAIFAMSKLHPSIKVKLVILGSGPDEGRLKALAERICPGRVHFAGFVSPEDLPKYYSGSDIYLHCAEFEPHSLAISEAIFMGLPLLLSDRCGSFGPTDDLQPGNNGFVYRTGEIDDLVKGLHSMICNSQMRVAFSERSRHYAVVAQNRSNVEFLTQALRADYLIS